MCSMIDSGEKGYKLPEQILFNSLVLYLTLNKRLIILHKFKKFYRNVQAIYTRFCDENADRRTDIQGLSNSL